MNKSSCFQALPESFQKIIFKRKANSKKILKNFIAINKSFKHKGKKKKEKKTHSKIFYRHWSGAINDI